MSQLPTTLRLVLGDQLNANHTWFKQIQQHVHYVFMEVRTETDYATHHIQKVMGIFAAMRSFADALKQLGHKVHYIRINDPLNTQDFNGNLTRLIAEHSIQTFEYQLPDEFRLDQVLQSFSEQLKIAYKVYDTEHFYSQRDTLAHLFEGKQQYLMETFYRHMRKTHKVLVTEALQPLNGQWNFDKDNRKPLPKKWQVVEPMLFENNLQTVYDDIQSACIKYIGTVDPKKFIWPIDRTQALVLMDFFIQDCLPTFGDFQDAMSQQEWSIYHSRLSFALNIKLISPKELVDQCIAAYMSHPDRIAYNQLEGFVRQIIGWREYMRGIYWLKMPDYQTLNFFNHKQALPEWFWTGKTHMNCMKKAIDQSLDYAYAHHIQRLMVTGNFALLAGIDPDQIDAWYLGIYIDAFEWVEITNTRGMSQYADGGIVGSKPYVSSAAYIHKMSDYCQSCAYNPKLKTGHTACPFNSLYWHFYDRHTPLLASNQRIGMMYHVWHKMDDAQKTAILKQADYYLNNINQL